MTDVLDGLEELRRVMDLREIASLIERTARWVAPETFDYLPLWFPEHARKELFYKDDWSTPQMNKNRKTGVAVHKAEANRYASEALTQALGLRKRLRPNWSCCHIWGVDDASYQLSNVVVADPRFFSCIGNMVLLPTPLKAFTDAMPEVKAMLRICARNLYGWHCDHDDLDTTNRALEQWSNWDAYPKSWPRTHRERRPYGTMLFTSSIKAAADRRLAKIRRDLKHAGPHYPRDAVKKVLAYWSIPF